MRQIRKFSVFQRDVPADLYDRLVELYPAGKGPQIFNCDLPEGSELLQTLLCCLEERGYKPWSGFAKRLPGEISMRIERTYDKTDYERACCLVPRAKIMLSSYSRESETTPFRLEVRHIKPKVDLGCLLYFCWIVVTERLKQLFEGASLHHVTFRSIEIVGRGSERYQGQFWELTSDLILPPMSASCDLRNKQGDPYQPGRDQWACLKEGLYEPAEPRYTESALRSIQPFDLALTCEPVAPKYRYLIASQRFYQFCVEHKLKMDWIPVRIDPDPEGFEETERPRRTIVPVSPSPAPPEPLKLQTPTEYGVRAIAHIGPIAEYLIDPQMLEDLGKILPEGVKGDTFECELPGEDPRHAAIIESLEQWGFEPEPWWEVDEDLGEMNLYPYVIQRTYAADDFQVATLLEIRPRIKFGDTDYLPRDLLLQAGSIPPGEHLGHLRAYIIVSDRLKRLIEDAGLLRASFREALVQGREQTGWAGGYWELTSDLVLPPVGPPCTVLDALGEPFAGDYEYGCYLHEGRYQPPELHYLASEVESLGAFDFAITNERFGPDDHAQHHLVTSQRFYQFCVENALKVDWVPVRVDAA